jgi:hypothetical protein
MPSTWGKEDAGTLPQHQSTQDLANRFSGYFKDKIGSIREALDSSDTPQTEPAPVQNDVAQELSVFELATEQEIRKLIMSSPCKSCALDPLPTWLLKDCVDELAPVIAALVNSSLASGTVPNSLKSAHVRPLLKKAGMDAESLKSYRQVSNLPFIAKILEKVVASRLDKHFQLNDLHTTFQSAYKPNHSTETALLRVHSDILSALDSGSSCILVLLDLSAAFDTIDHQILLERLDVVFGVKGSALCWMTSYLKDRFQTVIVDGQKSQPVLLEYGVPQGSVLGPKLYSIYTKPLADTLEDKGGSQHFFADDAQLYRFVNAKSPEMLHQAVTDTELSVRIAQEWMTSNKLKCNSDKTEVIMITPSRSASPKQVSISIGGVEIKGSACVRNLGVNQDHHFTMEKQVSQICRSANMHLRKIGSIRRYLTKDATKALMHALVTSRLDYCNSLLYGLPSVLTDRLQRVQNKAARIVCRVPRQEHITPILRELHWLPVCRRIDYKILLYTYKSLHDHAPVYLQDLVQQYQPSRALRSSRQNKLCAPRTKTRYGDRSFSSASVALWNTLPSQLANISSLDCFKKSVKTYLFKVHYDD